MANEPIKMMSLDDARAVVQESLLQLERAQFTQAFTAGYKAGWEAALRRLAEFSNEKPEPSAPSPYEFDAPAKEIVLRIIQGTPGLRGVEIVAATATAGSPLNERTVRTALHRLKAVEQIRNDDGRWFAVAKDDDQAAA